MAWPSDDCQWCGDGVPVPPVAEVGRETLFVRVGYECPVGHRWFTRWPATFEAIGEVEVRCGECSRVVAPPSRAKGHHPACSRFTEEP